MKLNRKWLHEEFVDLSHVSDRDYVEKLTIFGQKVETWDRMDAEIKNVVVGKVVSIVRHENSDHMWVCQIDVGEEEPVQIVTGAQNVKEGDLVPTCLHNSWLPGGVHITKGKLRGVKSNGMLCSFAELGLTQNDVPGAYADGIWILNDEDCKPGDDINLVIGNDDTIVDFEITNNRPDCYSIIGLARESAAAFGMEMKHHEPLVHGSNAGDIYDYLDVEVPAENLCNRYTARMVANVKIGPSPKWLRNRLRANGVRPINNIVDITNYLLHAMGQPLHCFDVDKIKGNKIVVRTCPEGSPFTTLDGVEHKLDANDLMICNDVEPMCMAGVFGGLDSGVTEGTTSIFLESAYFNPTSVRKTARRHGLNTDSSFRFERGVDPNGTLYVLKLAALMVQELAGGEICGEVVDLYPTEIKPFPVTLSYDKVNALIGKEIAREDVDAILKSLEIEITARRENEIDLSVPTYRVDVQRPCDVIEDVLRIYGYNNVEISTTLHSSLSVKTATDSANALRELISEQLTAMGFNEIMNNSLTAESYYANLETYPATNCVKLLNPLSSDLNVMRQTLLFGGLESLAHNINRKSSDLMMYEFGNVYFFNPDAQSTAETPLAPYRESSRLALWLTGAVRQGNWARAEEAATFYDLKAIVSNIFARLGISDRELQLTQGSSDIFAASLNIDTRSGKSLGRMGVIAKPILKLTDIRQEVFFAELDWNAIVKLALKKKVTYSALPKTQPVKRDLALLLDNTVTMEQVEAVVRESERRLLKGITLFDVYEGKNLPEGKKSYAIAITLQDDEKTLQDKQIEAVMSKIVANLQKRLYASLR